MSHWLVIEHTHVTPSFVKPPVPKPVRTKTGSFIMLEPNSQERLITSPAPPIADRKSVV